MGVPLGHKNHRNSRNYTVLDIQTKYSGKEKYKIVNKTAVLSQDGKRFIMLAPGSYETYKVPNGVESIERGALKKAKVKVLYLPKSCKVVLHGASSEDFHVKYEVIKSESPIIGKKYTLVPKMLIFNDKPLWNELSSTIDRMRIPKAIKIIMKQPESVKIIDFVTNSFDSFGVQYTNDDRYLDHAPEDLKKYSIPEGVEKITGLGFDLIEDLTIPSTLEVLRQIHPYYSGVYSKVKKLHFKGCKTICNCEFNERLEVIEVPKGSLAHYREQFPDYQDKIIEV